MKLKLWVKVTISILILILFFLFGFLAYDYMLSGVKKNKEDFKYEVRALETVNEIVDGLSYEGLIRSEFFTKVYVKLNKINNIEAGFYVLNDGYSVREIFDIFKKGNKYNEKEISITFNEGVSIKTMASLIESKTNNTKEEVLELVNNKEYLNELINKYWFITNDVLNKELYYSLEGYLFPDTYRIYENSKVKDIFKKMLDKMESVLNEYKDDLLNSKFSIHEVLTFASIVQLEGLNETDMGKISSVFHNRYNQKMMFQSCVTACYGEQVDKCFGNIPTSSINPYNTYLNSMAGKLPIGPIGSFGKLALKSTLYPEDTKYIFFLSDSEKNTYFSVTYSEHDKKAKELQKKGTWLR